MSNSAKLEPLPENWDTAKGIGAKSYMEFSVEDVIESYKGLNKVKEETR